jgi:hypothetical protein
MFVGSLNLTLSANLIFNFFSYPPTFYFNFHFIVPLSFLSFTCFPLKIPVFVSLTPNAELFLSIMFFVIYFIGVPVLLLWPTEKFDTGENFI